MFISFLLNKIIKVIITTMFKSANHGDRNYQQQLANPVPMKTKTTSADSTDITTRLLQTGESTYVRLIRATTASRVSLSGLEQVRGKLVLTTVLILGKESGTGQDIYCADLDNLWVQYRLLNQP